MFTKVNLLFLSLLKITSASISLNITGSPQLNVWEEDMYTKVYNYNFTPYDFTYFRCVYAITRRGQMEYYKITFYLDGEPHAETVTFEDNGEIWSNFSIKEGSNNITCKAQPEEFAINKVDRVTYSSYTCVVKLHLHDRSLPDVLDPAKSGLIITGSPKLTFWQQADSFTKIYNYSFTDHELAKFNCSLDIALPQYRLIFYLDGRRKTNIIVTERQHGATLSGTFNLRKTLHNITCGVQRLLEERDFFTSVVLLHYTPLSESRAIPTHLIPARPEARYKPSQPPVLSAITTPEYPIQSIATTTSEIPNQPIQLSTGPGAMSVPSVVATMVAIVELIIIALLIAIILNYRKKVQELGSYRSAQFIENRPALELPSENVYDHVYSHGAGLRRPCLK